MKILALAILSFIPLHSTGCAHIRIVSVTRRPSPPVVRGPIRF